jgi:hypothetical protein
MEWYLNYFKNAFEALFLVNYFMIVEKSTVRATSKFMLRMDSPFSLYSSVVDRLKFFTFFITTRLLFAEASETDTLKL